MSLHYRRNLPQCILPPPKRVNLRKLSFFVIPESRSDIRTAEAGCRSEHRRSRWPEGQAAGRGAFPSAFAPAHHRKDAGFRFAPERRKEN
jgi:hypothetical protein